MRELITNLRHIFCSVRFHLYLYMGISQRKTSYRNPGNGK